MGGRGNPCKAPGKSEGGIPKGLGIIGAVAKRSRSNSDS